MLKIVALKEKELPVTYNKFSKIQFKFTQWTNIINSRIRKHNTTSRNTDQVSFNKSDLLNVVEINFEIFTLQELTTLSRLSSKFLKLLKERYEKFNNSVNLHYNRIFNDSNGPEKKYRTDYGDCISPETVNHLKDIEQKLSGNRLRFLKNKIILEDIPRKILSCNNKAIKLQALKTITSITKHNKTTFFYKQWLLEILTSELSSENKEYINDQSYRFAIIEALSTITDYNKNKYSYNIQMFRNTELISITARIIKSSENLKELVMTATLLEHLIKISKSGRQEFNRQFNLDDINNIILNAGLEKNNDFNELYVDIFTTHLAHMTGIITQGLNDNDNDNLNKLEKIIKHLMTTAKHKKSKLAVANVINKAITRNRHIKRIIAENNSILSFLISAIKESRSLKEAGSTVSTIKKLPAGKEAVALYKKNKLVDALVELEEDSGNKKENTVMDDISSMLIMLINQDEVEILARAITCNDNNESSDERLLTISKYKYLMPHDTVLFNKLSAPKAIKSLINDAVKSSEIKLRIAATELLTEFFTTLVRENDVEKLKIFIKEKPAAQLINICNNKYSKKERLKVLFFINLYINETTIKYRKDKELEHLAKNIIKLDYNPAGRKEKAHFAILINEIIIQSVQESRFSDTKEGLSFISNLFLKAHTETEKNQACIIAQNLFSKEKVIDFLKFLIKNDILEPVLKKVIDNGRNLTENKYIISHCKLVYNLTLQNTIVNKHFSTEDALYMFNNMSINFISKNVTKLIMLSIDNIMKDNPDGQRVFIKHNILDLIYTLYQNTGILTERLLTPGINILAMYSEHSDLLDMEISNKLADTLSLIIRTKLKLSNCYKIISLIETLVTNNVHMRYKIADSLLYQWMIKVIINSEEPELLLPAFKTMALLTKEPVKYKMNLNELVTSMITITSKAFKIKRLKVTAELSEAFIESLSNLINLKENIVNDDAFGNSMRLLMKKIYKHKNINIDNLKEPLANIIAKMTVVDDSIISCLIDMLQKVNTVNDAGSVFKALEVHKKSINFKKLYHKRNLAEILCTMTRAFKLDLPARLNIASIYIYSQTQQSIKVPLKDDKIILGYCFERSLQKPTPENIQQIKSMLKENEHGLKKEQLASIYYFAKRYLNHHITFFQPPEIT